MITQTLKKLFNRATGNLPGTSFKRLANVDDIDQVRSRHPDFATMRSAICRAGTDSLAHFKNGYTEEGGLYLQQNPDEFAALCFYLKEHGPYENYLEIGSASGGACLFLQREAGISKVWSLDDGRHPRAIHQKENFSQIANFQQYLGDSHADEARAYLTQHLTGKLDIAFIDGDHSYEGAWQDVELVLPHCRSGTIMLFHDTVACAEVRQVWLRCIEEKLIEPQAEYVGEVVPLGIGIGTVR